jgi:Fe-S-cluster-containing dehydrogenase component/DMSO reductase anchor subunit
MRIAVGTTAATRRYLMVASPENFPLLKELLAEQRRLATPVARFAEAHEASVNASALESVYRDLIPLSLPKSGEQYAFEVDLDSCTGCKACVSACHSLNGLDDEETWRDVGLIVGGDHRHPVQQTVTSACHHCADPACLNGCPVLAYEKDPVTGIVRHLDDQCIGCQYCVLKCPYDVPKYNARLGIVRKCDMCQSRLAEGEAPACVQACPTHAIRIVTVTTTTGGGVTKADTTTFLPAAPDPAYTQPTTRYVSERRSSVKLVASDIATLRPQPPHWPLAIMLTLMPLAVGTQLMAFGIHFVTTAAATRPLLLSALIAGAIGLVASVAHLGQPLRAWRIFLGWRTSWLSREAMVFGAWLPLAALSLIEPGITGPAAAVGVIGLICSVMIYADTRRVFWRWTQTGPRFFGSALLLGAATAFALGIVPVASAAIMAFATLAKLACDARVMRPLDEVDEDDVPTAAVTTARLLTEPLRLVFGMRVLLAVVAGLVLPLMALMTEWGWFASWCVFAAVLIGDLMERHLFFRAVDAPKMPGLPGVKSGRR